MRRVTMTALVAAILISLTGCLEIKSSGEVGFVLNRKKFRFGDPAAALWGANQKKGGKKIDDHPAIRWTSDKDDPLTFANGKATLPLATLSPGKHTITAGGKAGGKEIEEKAKIEILNEGPSGGIDSPSAGESFKVAYPVTLRGRGSDAEDDSFAGGLKDDQFTWAIAGPASRSATGKIAKVDGLPPGSYTVTLTVRDRAGVASSSSSSFRVVNQAPEARIGSVPATVTVGRSAVLSGEAFDLDSLSAPRDPGSGAPLPLKIAGSKLSWYSDRDGFLGTGESLQVELKSGRDARTPHRIELVAEDEFGAKGRATANVVVLNQLPVVDVSTPRAGDRFSVVDADRVPFKATATDPDGMPISEDDVSWLVDGTRLPGTGREVEGTLTPGEHTIACRVVDAHGGVTVQRVGKVEVINKLPEIRIDSPGNDATLTVREAEAVDLRATVSDPDGFPIADEDVRWRSSLHSLSSDRGRSAINRLNPGRHRLTASATDRHGGTSSTHVELTVVNRPPTANISWPNQPYQDLPIGLAGSGEGLRLEASVSDPDGFPIEDTNVRWISTLDGELPGRGARAKNVLSVGLHRITCQVTDRHGATRTSPEIAVNVTNMPPRFDALRVLNDANGAAASYFTAADMIRFEVEVKDPDNFPLEDSKILWSSNVDGKLGAGPTLRTDTLSVDGAHTRHRITCEVTDRHGASVDKTVEILVTNTAPGIAAIRSPSDGQEFKVGESVPLRGRARDREDGPLQGGNIRWLLQKQGAGPRAKVATGRVGKLEGLAAGTYRLTLRAVDRDGLSKEATVGFKVVNQAPRVTVARPADATTIAKGEELVLTGSAFDPESGEVAGDRLTWTATRRRPGPNGGAGAGPNGGWGAARVLGQGKELRISDLQPGRYEITLTATDPQDGNLTAEASVRVRVTPPAPAGGNPTATPVPSANPAGSGGLSGAVSQ